MTLTGREVRLAMRPVGLPTPANFRLSSVRLSSPGNGELVVRNLFFSVDPYMRSRMDETMAHMDPFVVGAALDGPAVGRVVQSRSPSYREGDLVAHGLGWRDLAVLPAVAARPLPVGLVPPSAYLGVLGMPGMAAWYGLRHVGRFRPGETVLISGAAGAVGSTVGQLVKHRGGTVVAITSSDRKVRLLSELGFDHVVNYRDGDWRRAVRQAAPDGVDLYFDNVGGDQLELALELLKPGGRITACGMIAHANGPRPGPSNLPLIVGKRLTIAGYIVSDHYDLRPRFEREMTPLVGRGRVRILEMLVTGLESAPDAMIGLLRGDNLGKMLVEVP